MKHAVSLIGNSRLMDSICGRTSSFMSSLKITGGILPDQKVTSIMTPILQHVRWTGVVLYYFCDNFGCLNSNNEPNPAAKNRRREELQNAYGACPRIVYYSSFFNTLLSGAFRMRIFYFNFGLKSTKFSGQSFYISFDKIKATHPVDKLYFILFYNNQ